MAVKPLYLAGTFRKTNKTVAIKNPYDDAVVAEVAQAGKKEIDRAIQAATDSFPETRSMEPFERKRVLDRCVLGMKDRAEEFAKTLTLENGKTIREARGEVARAISTFEFAASLSWSTEGEAYDGGITEASRGRRILVRRFPIGPISAIAPFNFPLNLAAHKIAPAIAVGCPVVLKPASKTPLSSLLFCEILHETNWPKGAFSCLPCDRDAGQMLVEDERIKLLSFTGSPAVGWQMKKDAGKKKVVLELGGNAALIIDRGEHDWDRIIERMVTGAFYQCGQSCISVQRIYVHEDIYNEVKKRFVEAAQKLTVGDPLKEATSMGPVIDQKNSDRISEWIQEAEEQGATVLTGNRAQGTVMQPTVMEHVGGDAKLETEEVFGPVANLHKVSSIAEATTRVNDSKFGLQVGVFSNNFDSIQYIFNHCDVGGVIVNDVPSYRVDHMPYGGIKDSGLGREGIKYAMRDMTEEKAMVYFSHF